MREIIDLSLGLEDGIITYPTSVHKTFESSIVGRIQIEGRETRKFTMGSHCGTHVDAPKHFLENGMSVDQFDVNDLIGEALLINLGKKNPNQVIYLNNFKGEFLKYTNIKRIIFRTDWSEYWNTSQYYQGWPYFDAESIEFLINNNLKLLGIDFPSPDSAYFGTDCSMDSPNHKKLFSNNIILTEYLTNLNKLKPGLIFLMVSPLKLLNFDGAPSRVTAYNIN
jgi:arylformamidase